MAVTFGRSLGRFCRIWKVPHYGVSCGQFCTRLRHPSIEAGSKRFFNSYECNISDNIPLKPYKPPELEAWVTEFTTGKRLSIVKLNNAVFGQSPRLDIIQRVVVWQLAKRRAGTAKTKTRGEVRGGGRKPWRQKGSGRARHGSRRSPIFKGGGVVHGPRPRSYDYALPKKVRSMGLRAILSIKYTQGDLHVVDSLEVDSHRTNTVFEILKARGWKSVLLVDGGQLSTNLALSSRNIPNCDVLPSLGLNVYSILLRDTLVLSLGALRMLEERLTK